MQRFTNIIVLNSTIFEAKTSKCQTFWVFFRGLFPNIQIEGLLRLFKTLTLTQRFTPEGRKRDKWTENVEPDLQVQKGFLFESS